MRAVVTGGGTGGHIYPAIAVCESLKALDSTGEILYMGGTSGMEAQIVPRAGLPFHAVTARKMPVSLSIATARGMLALLKGYIEARVRLRSFGADVVVGTGGYVAAATVRAAAGMKIPTIILENNLIAGRTNLWLSKSARKICVSFQETIRQFPADRCVITGLPLRKGIVAPANVTAEQAREHFDGLDRDAFTLLVIGGSQGARALNNLVVASARDLTEAGIQILHQSGPNNLEDVMQEARKSGLLGKDGGYVVRPFLEAEEMPFAYRAADLLLCRGGISTLSEAAANGSPMIVVPLPTAYADHQTANAKAMEQTGAALHRAEATLNARDLTDEIIGLCRDRGQMGAMAAASLAAGRTNAADDVARIALNMKG